MDEVTKILFTKLPAPVNVKSNQQASISEALRQGAKISSEKIEIKNPRQVNIEDEQSKMIEINANDLRGGEKSFYDQQLKTHSIKMFKQQTLERM